MAMSNHTLIRFLKSALAKDSHLSSGGTIFEWLETQRHAARMRIELVPLEALAGWKFTSDGRLAHQSKRFFSIDGIEVHTDWGSVPDWDQPIINQPEIGYLGIIAREFDGILHFLMQAKIEPGNIGGAQLSPTLQATKSNYRQVHGGERPAYIDYFVNVQPENVLLDQLQSEQGARFLAKRNRNIIIEVHEDIPIYAGFRWMTLGQIKELMRIPNAVNMDTRTVISGIAYGGMDERDHYDVGHYSALLPAGSMIPYEMLQSYLNSCDGLHSIEKIISWITHLRSHYELTVRQKPLSELRGWRIAGNEIYQKERKYFRVVGANVYIEGREVKRWSQPLIESSQEGLLAFIIKKINGVYHFLVQAKLEPGNFDIVEFAPTVQCLTGNFRDIPTQHRPAYLAEIMAARPAQVLFDTLQSEEGGRFYREQNRNLLFLADDDFPIECSDNFCWMTLNQIMQFIRFNNYLNIQARSLISAIAF